MTNTDSYRAYQPSGTQPGADGAPFPLTESAVAMEIDLERTVPVALSDDRAALAMLDPDRTLPMEPELLEQLCAQTRVSERRRALPRELEYSLNVQLAHEGAPPAAVPDLAARLAARHGRGRRLLARVLLPCLGLLVGVGAGVVWQLGPHAWWSHGSRAALAAGLGEPPAAGLISPPAPPFTLLPPSEAEVRASTDPSPALLAETQAAALTAAAATATARPAGRAETTIP